MLHVLRKFLVDQGATYVDVRGLAQDESLRGRNEDALAKARAYLGDRHILKRTLGRGDYWRTRKQWWSDFDDRR